MRLETREYWFKSEDVEPALLNQQVKCYLLLRIFSPKYPFHF